jgi:uncharacterized protein (DUF362 family)
MTPFGPHARRVAMAWGPAQYDAAPPYGAGEPVPELRRLGVPVGDRPNGAHATVRESLRRLGLDAERHGSADWNPLGAWVRPGDTVVIKPNFVRHFRETLPGHDDCVTTHGSVIRAVLDYACLALGGHGRLIIADAPQNDADFEVLRHMAGLDAITEAYRAHLGITVEVYDLRPEAASKVDGVIVGHHRLPGDPAGYVGVDLGRHSAFSEIEALCHKLYGAEYDRAELVRHHTNGAHEYLVSRTVLDADCVISVPKLKTHKKVGLTANLKNLVGINGNKNWLPHHREGTPAAGGDQFLDAGFRRDAERAALEAFRRWFPRLGPMRRALARPLKSAGKRVFGDTNVDTVRSGNWYGNDTTRRMALDLNRLLVYADARGRVCDVPQRRFFSVVDGIVAGEGNGPLDPVARPTGVVLAGANPVAVDLACARMMGFDHAKIPMLHRALEAATLPLVDFGYDDIRIHSNDPACDRLLAAFEGAMLGFTPHFGWRTHIEVGDEVHGTGALV